MGENQRKKARKDENPYLAHMSQSNNVDHVKLEDGPNNYFTRKSFSKKYFEILEKRRELPVQKHRNALLDNIRNNQFTILVGETGSGKTTQ